MRFVYRHFLVVGEESLIAAMGSECAAEQGQFWEFHDVLFENWQGANQGHFSYNALLGHSDDLGMDAAQFEDCMTSGRAFERVREGHMYAERQGVNATPSVFINGKRMQGNYDVFVQTIEDALSDE